MNRARRRKLATRGRGTPAIITERIMHPAIQRDLRGMVRKLVRLRRELAAEQAKMMEPKIILTDVPEGAYE